MKTILGWMLALAVGLIGGHAIPARAAEVWEQLPAPAPLPKATESGYAAVNGIELWYAVYGEGQPVVFLHGGLANGEYWGNQVQVFAKQYKVILVDSRGHGRSTRDDKPYTYGLMASDVVALLDKLEIEKAAVVGWSDGGIIGLDLAIHHPERLTRVFAFGANSDPSGLREGLDTNATFNRFIEEAGQAYARLSKTPKDYDGFLAAIAKMWATEPNYTQAQLNGIKVPVAIADGEYDEAIKREHTEWLAQQIPGAKLVILPKVSHFAMLQNPAVFDAAVLAFLAGE
ncbi:alpha/beta hydrolase [Oleomonas cavernae]|uniref:Alpha/beta hydrolase n=1 Tax=Oleomonas cavernae TaxID=2320859 RepID=A0A418W957_9PROT|nr:alpha/beta hydrolase [Oleomonas cavernae]RJF86547.1 alpha/beta hydrolase [Oleomonas cavernae]